MNPKSNVRTSKYFLLHFLVILSAFILHTILTIYITKTLGWLAGVLTFLLMLFAEIYWGYQYLMKTGWGFVPITCLCFIGLFALQFITKNQLSMITNVHAANQADPISAELWALWEKQDIYSRNPFTITETHVKLLRQMRFEWSSVEMGAPRVDQNTPYGSNQILVDLEKIAETADRNALGQLHLESFTALRVMLEHGKLAPGKYKINNISTMLIRNGLPEAATQANQAPPGLDDEGLFEFTQEHRTLLEYMSYKLEWTRSYNLEGLYPVVEVDPKRPYNEIYGPNEEMAKELGWEIADDAEGTPTFNDDQYAAMLKLHWSMYPAIQVLVERADLPPGQYE